MASQDLDKPPVADQPSQLTWADVVKVGEDDGPKTPEVKGLLEEIVKPVSSLLPTCSLPLLAQHSIFGLNPGPKLKQNPVFFCFPIVNRAYFRESYFLVNPSLKKCVSVTTGAGPPLPLDRRKAKENNAEKLVGNVEIGKPEKSIPHPKSQNNLNIKSSIKASKVVNPKLLNAPEKSESTAKCLIESMLADLKNKKSTKSLVKDSSVRTPAPSKTVVTDVLNLNKDIHESDGNVFREGDVRSKGHQQPHNGHTTKSTGVAALVTNQEPKTYLDQESLRRMMEELITVNMEDQRFSVLSYEQVRRLNDVLHEVVQIHGRGNFPTLEIRLRDLVTIVRTKLEADNMTVRDIRINGGAASHILSTDEEQNYNDLDLIFAVDLTTPRHYDRVKNAVLDSLLDFLPEGVSKKRMSSCSMKEGYVNKMVKVNDNNDRWSLISLCNNIGRNIELKFVDSMKRQFEFSVDSFQIVLDSLILFYDCAEMPISENFYPTVVGESVYADFTEALYHLQKKLIATKNPEEIRGGGLLKYCNLLVKDYEPARPEKIKTLERYMCSRFFIDFPDVGQQQNKLENYLWNHLAGNDEALRYEYLMVLHRVVDESTVCLMGHERRQTLSLIDELACQVFYSEQQRLYIKQQENCSSSSSCTSSSSSNSSSTYDLHIAPPPPVIYSNGYYYAPIVPAPAPPQSYTCTCGWLQCA